MSDLELRDNPYVGLRPFFLDDNLYFFGREQQTAELLDILHQHRFLGVVGSSGSGKSSLVRAGLLPGLLGGFLVKDRDRWRTVQVKPGDAPTANLAAGLLGAMNETVTTERVRQFEKEIREGHTKTVLDFISPRLESNANLFLLVDQFEEIFAFRGLQSDEGEKVTDLEKRRERARRKDEAVDYVDLLLMLAQQRTLPVYVVLTMRTDFLGDCDLFYGLPEALNRGRYLVPRMTREQLRDAIECPAMLLDAQIAPRLLDCVLNELGDRFDRLPVLQHALLRTWDEWQLAGRIGPVDLQHYDAAGGLEGALNKDAENALRGLDKKVVARVFKRLTDTDVSQRRVRSPARVSELSAASGADSDTVAAIVQRFEGHGRSFLFGSADGKPDDLRIDISHESLIRQWDRLRAWVDEERDSRDQYLELVKGSRDFADGNAALLWPPGLEPFLDWRDKNNPNPEWAERYSATRDDYDNAIRYLDQSVDNRCRYLAETETRQRWQKLHNTRIVVLEVLIGVVTAGALELYKHANLWEAGKVIFDLFAPEKMMKGAEEVLKTPGSLNPSTESDQSVEAFSLFKFVLVWAGALLYLSVCGWLNGKFKKFHRKVVFPGILKQFTELDGREPAAEKAQKPEPAPATITAYATTFSRYAGFLIDQLAFMAMVVLVVFMMGLALGILGESEEEIEILIADSTVVILLVSAWLYETLQVSSRHQATFGMRAMRIYRTDLEGNRLSFYRATKWWLFRLISFFYGFGFVFQPFTKRRQTLHDLLAKSIVLRRPPAEGAPPIEQKNPPHVLLRVLQVLAYALVTLLLIYLIYLLVEFVDSSL